MTFENDPPVTIYTAPVCPACRALKAWMRDMDVAFTEKDLSEPGVAEEAKARSGVRVAPITLVGDRVFYGYLEDQRPKLIAALGLEVTD